MTPKILQLSYSYLKYIYFQITKSAAVYCWESKEESNYMV